MERRDPAKKTVLLAGAALLAAAAGGPAQAASTDGLRVEAEGPCRGSQAEYSRERDYTMGPEHWYGSLKGEILWRQEGHVFEPYTMRQFTNTKELQIEHVVAIKEAHDSGLCGADAQTKLRFVDDLDNLTVATPEVNRAKGARDAGEWAPEHNRCWFAATVTEVKRKYRLSVDEREKAALDEMLAGCGREVAMRYPVERGGSAGPEAEDGEDALARYDDNGNGRITCKEARRHGIAPVMKGHPAYPFMRDANKDGRVC